LEDGPPAEPEKSKIASTVYDRDGAPVATLYTRTRLWIKLRDVPLKLRQAFIATEDSRFYRHKGIDFRGITRALYQDLKTGRKTQGGSTITQQLVKNIFLSQKKSFIRKVLEMAYAIRIEQQYGKDQILEFYLNSIYLGHGTLGVGAAARVYFGKTLAELTLSEEAMLAALTKSPEYYTPFRHPAAALSRRNLVLRLMAQHGYLTERGAKTAAGEELKTLNTPGVAYVGAYFVDAVIKTLLKETAYSEIYLRAAGLKIYTTMDRRIQQMAEAAVVSLPVNGPDRWGISQPQGALVALDPKSGAILGLVGGRRFTPTQVNRGFQIYRQPGSAIKPFVFAAALEEGFTPESMLPDEPLEIMVNGKPWRPQNYDNKYRGWVSLSAALEESVNTIAVRLVEKLGATEVFNLTKRMGLTSLVKEGYRNDLGLAPLALGGLTKGVTLLELTSAYSSFANQGIYSRPYGILRVYDNRGRLLYRSRSRRIQVIKAETAAALTAMMAGVITRGTGVRANPGQPAAGKTGTTNKNTNGWFIGYTRDLLAGVWIGNDQSNQSLIVNGVSLGSGTAAAIWGNFVRGVPGNPATP